jgi:TonB family protein
MSARPAGRPPAPGLGLGRPAVLLSLGLHAAAFVVTLGVPRLLASSPRAAPVYVVDLVSFAGGSPGPAAPSSGPPAAAAKPKPPAPPPKKEPEKKAPEKKAAEKAIVIPERGAKKTPPQTPPKPAAKPEPPAKPVAAEEKESKAAETAGASDAQSAAAPAAGGKAAAGAPGGTPGATGAGGQGTGVGGDAYNFYMALLNRSIKEAWKRPLYSGNEVFTATVRVEISRSGRLVKLTLVTSSGLEALDRSVLSAVRDAEPFAPLPTNLTLETLAANIEFELNPQASETGSPRE